jgi:glycine reductase
MNLVSTLSLLKVFERGQCLNLNEGDDLMLEGKKIAIIGDRDGVPGMAIAECLKTTDAEVVFTTTECFV